MIASRTIRRLPNPRATSDEQHDRGDDESRPADDRHVQDHAGADDDERHPVRRVVAIVERDVAPSAR